MRGLILAFLLTCSQAWGAIALVTSVSGGSSGNFNTTNRNTTGANLIVLVVSCFGVAPTTVADSASNVWTPLTNRVQGSYNVRMFYTINPTTSANHVFSENDAAFCGMTVLAFSGVTPGTFDVQNGGGTASGSTVQPGSITPNHAGELVITGEAVDRSASPTITAGYSAAIGINFQSAVNIGNWASYIVQTSAVATNPTWTNGGSGTQSAAIASFQGPAASGNCAACDMSGKLEKPHILASP